MDIGVGLSLQKNPVLAAKEAVILAKENMVFKKPDFGILFTSLDLSCNTLLKTITETLGDTPIIGSSAPAIISNKGVFNQGLVLLLVKMPEGGSFNIAYIKNINSQNNIMVGKEMGEKLLHGLLDKQRLLSLIISDSPIPENSGFIHGLKERLGMGFPLLGAFTSDNPSFSNNYTYLNKDLLRNTCIGLLLTGRLYFGLGSRHGWQPLGKPHFITSAEDNVLQKIDDKPAADLYAEYLGCDWLGLKKNLKQISALYPIGIKVNKEECFLRNIASIEDNGSIRLQGNLPPDARDIRLMIGTKEACLEGAREAAKQTKIGFIGAKANIKKFAIVFSSMARQSIFKKDCNQELEAIKNDLGENTPIIGMCPYGELVPTQETNYPEQMFFYNRNITILTIGG